MRYFCLGHDILGVHKSLRIELGGWLPLTSAYVLQLDEYDGAVQKLVRKNVITNEGQDFSMDFKLQDWAEEYLRSRPWLITSPLE
jgi:hypothetical protein